MTVVAACCQVLAYLRRESIFLLILSSETPCHALVKLTQLVRRAFRNARNARNALCFKGDSKFSKCSMTLTVSIHITWAAILRTGVIYLHLQLV
jgi:hypothetical protein